MAFLLVLAALAAGLPAAERAFVAFRDADDAARLAPGRSHASKRDRCAERVRALMGAIDPDALSAEDRRAFEAMRGALTPDADADDPATRSVYDAFRAAAASIPFDGQTLDRLTILGKLAEEPDPERRRRLFLALSPVWESVAGRSGMPSPYGKLVAARKEAWRAGSPFEAKARAWGMTPEGLESSLERVLAAWRDHLAPDEPVEPWDWYFQNGAASRSLASALTLDATIATARRYFRDLGADPETLGVELDLVPRRGKDPVAFTDFLRHGRYEEGRWKSGKFRVSASYRAGGLGNLYELMHELGHAAHIAAIRARPAFNDWPDSDVLTEALADVLGVEAYEPGFTRRYLGRDLDPIDAARDRLSGTILDVAWALFEIRVHGKGGAPNDVWSEITERYLRVKPHPELAWWATRGQLIDSPGYMANYAMGAVLTETIRQRVRALRGEDAFEAPSPELYAFLSERLYRFGLGRPSRQVVEEFLGGPVDPAALEAAIAAAAP